MWDCGSTGKHMPEPVFLKTLAYIRKANAVNIVGGEPTLHPKFIKYILMMSVVSKKMRLVTNGSWLKPDIPYVLSKVSRKLGHQNFLVRISNDRFHRKFISEKSIKVAAEDLIGEGVNVLHERIDSASIYPLGRALKGSVFRHIQKLGILSEPAECTKSPYDPWDSLSIDVNGDVSICPHHQAICGNIMDHRMNAIVDNAILIMKQITANKPTNAYCSECKDHHSIS